MKFVLLAFLALAALPVRAGTPEVGIPEQTIATIRPTDTVDVAGTNDSGGAEAFTIHNDKAIRQFLQLIASQRYIAVPKSLKPKFKSASAYTVRLSARGAPLLELRVVADSVLDLPNDPSYYMQADEYSDNLMAPLLRLR